MLSGGQLYKLHSNVHISEVDFSCKDSTCSAEGLYVVGEME